MPTEQQVSQGHGVVVLAAYRPDPELFAVQLRSIRDQTRSDFRVLIGADGGQDEVQVLVDGIVGDDPRFEVIGWDDNVGFYLNFERLLMAVQTDAAWVALSDQDDRWYPDKLERLLPLLDHSVLATGQARVVVWPGDRVVLDQTNRRVVPAEDLIIQNQVTGALSVLRRDLLDLALPFPRLHTVTQLHDHWLAMCAVVRGGYAVLDEVVQDYVQHGGNLVGEVGVSGWTWTPTRVVRRWLQLADEYEGAHGPIQLMRASQNLAFGWRRLVALTLVDRASARIGPGHPLTTFARTDHRGVVRILVHAIRSRHVSPAVVATMLAGAPGEVLGLGPKLRAREPR